MVSFSDKASIDNEVTFGLSAGTMMLSTQEAIWSVRSKLIGTIGTSAVGESAVVAKRMKSIWKL